MANWRKRIEIYIEELLNYKVISKEQEKELIQKLYDMELKDD